jgi:hypothetical protein
MKKVPLLVLKELGYIYQLYQLCQFHWHLWVDTKLG